MEYQSCHVHMTADLKKKIKNQNVSVLKCAAIITNSVSDTIFVNDNMINNWFDAGSRKKKSFNWG